MTFRILWLDPGFNDNEELCAEVEDARKRGFLIDTVNDYDNFCSQICNNASYHAIILELAKLNPNDRNDFSLAYRAYQLAASSKNSLVYLYSIDDKEPHITPFISELAKNGCCFNKGQGTLEMFDKIEEQLNSRYHYYKHHEECNNVFIKKWIPEKYRECMDHILEQFSKDDSELLLQNQIRQILECILRKLTDIHLIPKHFDKEDSAKNDFETLNKKVDYLTKTCHFKHTADGGFEYSTRQFKDKILKKKIPDFDTPIVPYALCSAETKKTIAYLAEITNLYSHALDITKDKVLGENEQHVYCPPYVCKSIYAAFISVIIWYNDFMKKHEESGSVFNMLDQIKEPNVIPFAQLEWDDEWCVYHCGNYMVPTEDVERNKYKKNEYHYIICSEPMNADGKYKRKAKLLYPQNS